MTDQQNSVQPLAGASPADAPPAFSAAPPTIPQAPGAPAAEPATEPIVPSVSYVDDYQPPAPAVSPPATQPGEEPVAAPAATPPLNQPTNANSQTLEDQNIFFLLGVDDGTDEEKESFLDELQQVIWEDFLENDVQLLITAEENQGLKQIQSKTGLSEEDKQEEMVVYLEKLIPDLEEIMLEKAMELKEDMIKERLAGMREYYTDQPLELKQLDEADNLIKVNRWRDAAAILNSLKA
jgi:hypothetical protein